MSDATPAPSAIGNGVEEPGGLARSLGLGQVTASGVGIIIGAGIYVLLGAATAEAGAAVWIAFGVAGLLSGLTALSYAELAAMFPNAGAEYDYTRRVAPEWAAFLVGWVMILGLVIAAAAVSLGFASYMRYFIDVPQRLGAWALLGLVTAIALRPRSNRPPRPPLGTGYLDGAVHGSRSCRRKRPRPRRSRRLRTTPGRCHGRRYR